MGMYACLPGKEEEGSQDPLGWNERGLCPPIHWTRKALASCGSCTKGLVRNRTTAPGVMEKLGLEGGDSFSELAYAPLYLLPGSAEDPIYYHPAITQ